jgi:uncharacterized protein YjdB
MQFVTVNVVTSAAPITGPSTICAGSSATLSSSNAGGAWSSGATAFATINASTGLVQGVAAGSAPITYTFGSCSVSATVTVIAAPAAITGTTNVCVGSSVTFVPPSGPVGTWASGNTALATVDVNTGLVTGVSFGTPVITYFISPGCFKTKSIIVNGGSNAISGTKTVCHTGSTNVSCTTPGALQWVSSNPAIATIGSASGVVNGISVGTAIITHTTNTAFWTCYSTTVVTVNPLPTAISGSLSACVNTTTLLSSDSTGGGTWMSSNLSVGTVVLPA